MPLEGGWVADQARALLEDMPVAAFKLGMLGSVEAIAAVAEVLSDYPDTPVVFDPVLASGRGDAFADFAPGQFEVNLQHVTDPLRACDHAVLLKRAVKAAALKNGLETAAIVLSGNADGQ